MFVLADGRRSKSCRIPRKNPEGATQCRISSKKQFNYFLEYYDNIMSQEYVAEWKYAITLCKIL
jgi:hypothetical protein